MGTGGDGEGEARPGVVEYVVRGSHRSLAPSLERLAAPRSLRRAVGETGLVVVPIARPEPLLGTAAVLAGALGWPLLLLCSRDNNAHRVHQRVRRDWPGLEVTVADLLHRDLLRAHREWLTIHHWAAHQRADVDTNRKRNLGSGGGEDDRSRLGAVRRRRRAGLPAVTRRLRTRGPATPARWQRGGLGARRLPRQLRRPPRPPGLPRPGPGRVHRRRRPPGAGGGMATARVPAHV